MSARGFLGLDVYHRHFNKNQKLSIACCTEKCDLEDDIVWPVGRGAMTIGNLFFDPCISKRYVGAGGGENSLFMPILCRCCSLGDPFSPQYDDCPYYNITVCFVHNHTRSFTFHWRTTKSWRWNDVIHTHDLCVN